MIFNAFYNISYNARYAQAMQEGGGARLAQAVAETFSRMALLSAATGSLIVVFTFILVPKISHSKRNT